MINLPNQRIPNSEKTEKWAKECIDNLSVLANQHFGDWKRFDENYAVVNSQLTKDYWVSQCSEMGIKSDFANKYAESFNIIYTTIQTMLGEELNNPFNFSVVNNNPNDLNTYKKDKEKLFQEVIDNVFKEQMERASKINEIRAKKEAGDITEREADKKLKELFELYQKEDEQNLQFYKAQLTKPSLTSVKESTIQYLMRHVINKHNLKWLKNSTFEDAMVAGCEFAEIIQDNEFQLPTVKELNPKYTFYHKSSNTPFIQDGDLAGYRETMTQAQVLKHYSDYMTDYELKSISNATSGVYGVNNAATADKFHDLVRSGMYPSQTTIEMNLKEESVEDILERDTKFHMQVMNGYANLDNRGLYTNNDPFLYNSGYYVVYTVYWRSQRMLYVMEHKDEYGKDAVTLLPDTYELPKEAKKEEYSEFKFDKGRYRYTWQDENGEKIYLREIWIPEIWTGTKINNNIYCKVGPVNNAYQSILDPYNVKLPIHGYVYSGRNANPISLVDRMKPWLKLYYAIIQKWLKLQTQDKGNIIAINQAYLGLGIAETIELAEDTGFLIFNPYQNAGNVGSTILNSTKFAEKLDVSNASTAQYYLSNLEWIENQMIKSIGMSPQRLAQTYKDSNVSDNQRDTQHSMNMTERFFQCHEYLWQQIMQSLMEKILACVKTSTIKNNLKAVLSDSQFAVLDLDLFDSNDEFTLSIGNNQKSSRILSMIQAQAQSLFQNGLSVSQFIKLLKQEDLVEFQKELSEIEEAEKKEKQDLEQQKLQVEREKIQALKDNQEDKQINELDIAFLKGKLDNEREHIRGEYLVKSYNMEKDLNVNGVPDVLEFNLKSGDLQKRAEQRDIELSQKDRKIALEEQQHLAKVNKDSSDLTLKENIEAKKLAQEASIAQLQAALKLKELEVEKQKIAKSNSK